MVSDASEFPGKSLVISIESSSITITTKIFRRKERCRPDVTYRSGFFGGSVFKEIISAGSLSGIFDNKNIMFFSKLHNTLHFSTLTKYMDRNNCFSFRSDSFSDCFHRYIKCPGFRINNYWFKTKQRNNLNCRYKSEICCNHFISGFQAENHHS